MVPKFSAFVVIPITLTECKDTAIDEIFLWRLTTNRGP